MWLMWSRVAIWPNLKGFFTRPDLIVWVWEFFQKAGAGMGFKIKPSAGRVQGCVNLARFTLLAGI